MLIACEDLAQYGVVLIPPSAPEYQSLVADIVNRLHSRPKGGPPVDGKYLAFTSEHDNNASAVLLNRADRAIVSIAYVWHVRLANGRRVTHSYSPGTNASVLLPFELNQFTAKFNSYWCTIFPGSKRLVRFDGSILGDNTDIRTPEPDELWHGGFFHTGAVAEREGREPVKFTLDGVFFEDGGFAGPNQLGSWERTTSAAETYLEVGALAREAKRSGMALAKFFLRMRALTRQSEEGRLPPPPPPGLPRTSEPLREHERIMVGWRVLQMRERLSDDVVTGTRCRVERRGCPAISQALARSSDLRNLGLTRTCANAWPSKHKRIFLNGIASGLSLDYARSGHYRIDADFIGRIRGISCGPCSTNEDALAVEPR